jgi:hypothetical protein
MLIEKDGGIRPCEVLATCAYKVLHSTQQKGQISESQISGLFSQCKHNL